MKTASGSWRIGPSPGSVHLKYHMLDDLGKGSYGFVKLAIRISDHRKVAIKFAPKPETEDKDYLPGYLYSGNSEVDLMNMMKEPHSPHIIELLEWFEDQDNVILVMEYPEPCETLYGFIKHNNGRLEHSAVRMIIVQIVQAAKDCIDHGVCHGDIHSGNILVNTTSLNIKLIDFGCGLRIGEEYPNPEMTISQRTALKITIQSVGHVLSEVVNLALTSVPEEFQELISWCEHYERQLRPRDILMHPWLRKHSVSDTEEGKTEQAKSRGHERSSQ
ncbi:hypothetical protein G5714_020733 [Onychostoma macrolepis]|uniref:non-specific serine/threonine protein kinase n=1 Tax=Onychostoma macrolepis TaxID=369639 RepID=A0A7J6BW19_9TELE|nr:hypothetical protein G5714_020733 [Onychostoma macrolepis]